MTRYWLGMVAAAVTAGAVAASVMPVQAQTGTGVATASATTDLSAQQRRRRITVYPRARTALGPNSVRQCRTRLEQEYRPSGTVIFPRMSCWWE